MEAISDRLDAMDEETFDLAEIDAYLEELDRVDPVFSAFDAPSESAAFRARHAELFREPPGLKVLEGKKRRAGARRIAGRVAALAATIALVGVVVCAAMGIDLLSFFGQWGRGEFWFPDAKESQEINDAGRPPLKTGTFKSLQDALDENGVTISLAPTLVPGPCEQFGVLRETVQVSQEAQSGLFEADYRDSEGRGYTVSLERSDFRNSEGHAYSLGAGGVQPYVCDGVSYYLAKRPDGSMWVSWAKEDWTCEIDGDLTRDTAMALCRSITEGKGYTPPSADYAPIGNELGDLLEVVDLDPNLAPAWLPEGFVKTDLHSQYGGIDNRIYTVNAVYDDAKAGRKLTYHVEWWEEPAAPTAPIFAWDGDAGVDYEHNGVTFRVRESGTQTLVSWLDGHVSGYLWGDMSGGEAREIVDSIPVWSREKPEPDNSGIVSAQPERKKYDSLAEAVAESGFDPALAPGWLPEGYELESCETTDLNSWFDLFAAYTKGEDYLMVHLTRYKDTEGSSGSATYIKDDEPVVEYERNGIIYYIMTNHEFRNIVWKYGDLEGSIGGPITLEEAERIVDSIDFAAVPEE